MTCSIDGCDRKVKARGWCNMHWYRWRDHGDPLYRRKLATDWLHEIADRHASGWITVGCIPAPSAEHCGAYGGVSLPGRTYQKAHRYVLRRVLGEPPEDRPHALHTCRMKACCNPAHLRWGSPEENMRDAVDRDATHVTFRGNQNGNAKLTDEQVSEMLERYDAGESAYSIAPDFGVSNVTVYRWANKRSR